MSFPEPSDIYIWFRYEWVSLAKLRDQDRLKVFNRVTNEWVAAAVEYRDGGVWVFPKARLEGDDSARG